MCVLYYSDKSQFSLFQFRDFIECAKREDMSEILERGVKLSCSFYLSLAILHVLL